MELKYIMRALRILFFVVLVISFSCEEKGWIIDCSDCQPNEPEFANLNVKLKDIDTPVRINVYEGELEDSVLYYSVEAQSHEYSFSVRLNKKYTVTATYNIEGKTYTAVDSATPKVRYTEEQCEKPCYYTYDRVVDLRLKYTVKGE